MSRYRHFGLRLRCGLFLILVGCGGPLAPELFVHGARLSHADAVVVLGHRPPSTSGGAVAPETDRRMRRGAELYRRGLAPLLIITGSAEEAQVMVSRANELGVPASAIRVDRHARDTADNARNAVQLACGGQSACAPRLIVVSSAYHLQRAQRLFVCAGAQTQVAAAEIPDDRLYQISFAAYEYGVRFAYVFYDACARARPPLSGGPSH